MYLAIVALKIIFCCIYLSKCQTVSTQTVKSDSIKIENDSDNFLSPEQALQQLLINYTRTQRPKRGTKSSMINNQSSQSQNQTTIRPLIVEVNMFIHSFSSISVVNMDFTVDFMLRQRWLDQRLRLANYNYNFSYLPISYVKDLIWIPDLFFRNAKNGFLHQMTTPNYLIWINSNGLITFSQKISMILSCHMSLRRFPLDTQYCTMNIGSYGYSKTDLEFRWWNHNHYDELGQLPTDNINRSLNKAVQIRSDLEINEFDLLSYEIKYCKMEYSTTGEFSCLEAIFCLKRRFGFYMIYAYLPSLLVAIIAWLSFFVDPEAVPARISIGLLCVLALITQSAAVLTQVPPVSYTKAIDVWFFICLAFVVGSLLEFAIANSLGRKTAQTKSKNNDKYLVLTSSKALNKFLKQSSSNLSNEQLKIEHNNNDGNTTNTNRNTTITNNNNNNNKFDNSNEIRWINPDNEDECQSLSNLNNKNLNQNKHEIKNIQINPLIKINHWSKSCLQYSNKHDNKPAYLDHIFAIAYPVVFSIFNVIYWSYYLS